MASAIKKVEKIRQIVRLKQVMQRWKSMSIRRRSILSYSDSDSDSDAGSSSGSTLRIPSGFLAVYVGLERRRFLIPTRFLNLPIFGSLLKKAEEEFGFQTSGGLVLPCDVSFFKELLKFLERDEKKFGGLSLDEIFKVFSEVGFDSCKDLNDNNVSTCHQFTPLLQKG